MSEAESKKTVAASSVSKKVVELEVVKSDRIELVSQANRFVEAMRNSDLFDADALAEEELATYIAALAFLQRQFSDGFKDSETIETRVELESK